MAKSRDFNEFNDLYEYAELEGPSELEVKLREYSSWMLSKNFSQRTIANTGYTMARFIRWCHERGILSPGEVTREILEHYQCQLRRYRKRDGKLYGVGYLSMILSIIRAFFRWLAKRRYILYNPASELELPRVDKHIPRNVMSIPEVEAVMTAVDLSSPLGLRDRAILEVLYSTGIRRFELCQLACKDLYSNNGMVLIRDGKGRKDRMVPIGERALAWVEKYKSDLRPVLLVNRGNLDKSGKLHNRANDVNDEGILFLSYRGRQLDIMSVGRIAKTYIQNSGIEKDGCCHMFRHTMATLMLDNGADIRYIQQILGHTSLETTQVYTHVSIKKLKEIHEKTHPGANLRRDER